MNQEALVARRSIEAQVIRVFLIGVCGVAIVFIALLADRLIFAPARIPSPTRLAVTVVEDLDESAAWVAGRQPGGLDEEVTVEAQWSRRDELHLKVSKAWGNGVRRIELWLRSRKQKTPSVKGRVVLWGGSIFSPVLDLTGKVELEPSVEEFLERVGKHPLVIRYDLNGVCGTDSSEESGVVVLVEHTDPGAALSRVRRASRQPQLDGFEGRSAPSEKRLRT